ncbi:MAG: hypothetical protein AMJ78_02840 [Omnitrophica WOR_2 bacterium SM23_29]|nr:MAG: hypothetical protein AMJ78_02840 [Omnitrophica WOR_2 bacterium SM23_29]
MRAILLAAGIGKRLKPLTDITPKSLIRVGDKTVLERMLDSLIGVGIKDIYVVVGHLKEKIKKNVGRKYSGIQVHYIFNRDYKRGSVLSVWAARRYFDDDMLLMDSDVIFENKILDRLVNSKNENCLLMDKDYGKTGEEMKIAALNKRVVQIARDITVRYDEVGEGVGFLKLSKNYHKELLTVLEGTIADDEDSDYEVALDKLVKRIPVGFEEATGFKWTEIDFKDDIEKAKALNL